MVALGGFGGWYLAQRFSLSVGQTMLGILPIVMVGLVAMVRPQLREALFILIPISLLITSVVGLSRVAPVLAQPESVRDLLAVASSRGYAATPVLELHTIERTAEFYAANRMTYAPGGEPVKLEGAAQVADAARRNGGLVLCFVPREYEAQLTSYQDMQTEVIANNGRVSLVAVRVR
jgi:hypothetical protein